MTQRRPDPSWQQQHQQPYLAPGPPPPHPGPIPPPAAAQIPVKKRRKWPWVVGAIVLLFVVIGMSGNGGDNQVPQAPTTPKVGTVTGPSSSIAAVPAVSVPVQDVPLAPARKITAREWQLIAKDPSSHVGDRVIVYGQVTQFDAATGTEGFRANVDGVQHKVKYGYADYETNTVLHSDDTSLLANVVEKDLFKAEVTVAGAQTYDTAIGGSATAPQLTVTKIDVVGHVD